LLVKSVTLLGIATLITKLSGFGREMALAAFYGAGTNTDAFILAITIQDVLFSFITLSIVASFIPMYHRVDNKTNYVRNIMTSLLVFGLLISLIVTIFPHIVIRAFAFSIPIETFELSVFFVRYTVWAFVFLIITEIYSAQLEIHSKFFFVGVRTVWTNCIVILGIVLGSLFEYNLILAVSPLVGSLLSMIFLASRCKKINYTYRPYINPDELKQILIISSPVLISATIAQINIIINRNFAAILPEGTISYLHYSLKVTTLISALFGQSFFTVLYPRMSKMVADSDLTKLKETLMRGAMFLFVIIVPLSVAVFVFAQPIIRILFQRGAFNSYDTLRTASALRMYALLVFSGSLLPLFQRAFFALRETKIPAISSIVAVIFGIIMRVVLIGPLGAEGLALAGSLGTTMSMTLLIIFLSRKLGGLGLKSYISDILKISLVAVFVGACIWFLLEFLPMQEMSIWLTIIVCFALFIMAVIVYCLSLILFKCKTLIDFINSIKNAFISILKKRRVKKEES